MRPERERRRRAGWAAAIGLAAMLVPALARADDPPASELIGVLQIDTIGVSETAGQKFEEGVVEGLGGAGFRVMNRVSMAKALAASGGHVDGCTFGPCLRAVHGATQVRLVLVARIEGVGRTYSFVVSLLDTRTGQPTSQVAQSCPVCTVDDAISTATLSTIELVAGLGSATVIDPAAGPTGKAGTDSGLAARARIDGERRSLRRVGWLSVAVGTALAASGLYLMNQESDWGPAATGGGVALAASGGLMVFFSGRLEF